jgi:hypothetical protein
MSVHCPVESLRSEVNSAIDQIEVDLAAVEVGLGELRAGYARLGVQMQATLQELARLRRGLGEIESPKESTVSVESVVRDVLRDAVEKAKQKRAACGRYWKVVEIETGDVIGGLEADSYVTALSVFAKALPPRIKWKLYEVTAEEFALIQKDAFRVDVSI